MAAAGSSSIEPKRLARRTPAPADIEAAFRAAIAANPRARTFTARGMTVARVPFSNQHELVAEAYLFDDAGLALGKELSWKHGAVLLWDGTSLELRKVSLRPSDHYLEFTIPREADSRKPFFVRLHHAMAAAFHGLPRNPDLLVRHRRDLRHRNAAKDLRWGCIHENKDDYEANRARSRSRDRVVLVRAKTARDAKARYGIKGEKLNRLVEKLLREYLAAA
jgi:hypothetical protein